MNSFVKLMQFYKNVRSNSKEKKRKKVSSRIFVYLAEVNRTTLVPCELKN